jgi:dihydropteroate synthase
MIGAVQEGSMVTAGTVVDRPAEPIGRDVPYRRLEALADAAPEGLWLRPTGLLSGEMAEAARTETIALPLAGGPLAFTCLEILARDEAGQAIAALAPLAELRRWSARGKATLRARVEQQLELLSAPRAAWAGLRLDRPLIMGIVNVTPDSFSDGGAFIAPEPAIAHGRALLAAGADILDIGGESTRPGATSVAPEDEIARVEPVLRGLAPTGAVLSIDTRHARVMEAALAAGARIINDVSALTGDKRSLAVAAAAGAPVVLMHMQGEPRTMQDNPSYRLASLDILEYLAERIAACAVAGIPRERVVVDPGIGFGKRARHNLEIMARLSLFHALGCGVLLGISRKSLIGRIGGALEPKKRLPGSLAGGVHALGQGVQILRVHDVAETRQAVATWQAIASGDQCRED